MCQCAQREVNGYAAVVEKLLKLGGCGAAVVRHELGLATNVRGIQSPQLKLWRRA